MHLISRLALARPSVLLMGLATLCAVSVITAPVSAQTPAATITGASVIAEESASYSHGFRFTPLTDITVTALGYFDFNDDGLDQSHNVGIWNDTTNVLLSSAIIPAGTSATLMDRFRYVPVASITLLAGQTYVAGGRATGNINDILAAQVPGTVTFDPALFNLPGSGVFNAASGFQKPAGSFSNYNAYLGPNFLIAGSSSAAPEPGTLTLLGTAFIVGGMLWKRRKGK